MLRRYHPQATQEELAYEHAVLGYLADLGWVVPAALGEPVRWQGRWYCLTRYVPGQAVRAEDARQRRRRGRDLARLHLALRGAAERLGQRPGWRAQHTAVTVRSGHPWEERVGGLASVSPRLAAWAQAAATQAHESLAALGADELPVMVVHGDFAAWNVHYDRERLAGVIDFGLTHVDTRPFELAIARSLPGAGDDRCLPRRARRPRVAAQRARRGGPDARLPRLSGGHGRRGNGGRPGYRRLRPGHDRTAAVENRNRSTLMDGLGPLLPGAERTENGIPRLRARAPVPAGPGPAVLGVGVHLCPRARPPWPRVRRDRSGRSSPSR